MIDIENNTEKYVKIKCLQKVNKCLWYEDRKGDFMTTLTLGRAIDTEDFLFVALNDSSYADWRASRNTSEAMAEMCVEKTGHETLGGRIKKFFSRK